MFQAGATTILAVLILVIIPAYMIQVFVKVVALVVVLGLLHGLVVLPIVYVALPFDKTMSRNEKHKVAPTTIAIEAAESPPPRSPSPTKSDSSDSGVDDSDSDKPETEKASQKDIEMRKI